LPGDEALTEYPELDPRDYKKFYFTRALRHPAKGLALGQAIGMFLKGLVPKDAA
jgi:hypothetical protein